MKNPILGVTMGDPAGVGPEIIVRAAAEPEVQRTSRPVVIGAASTLTEAAALVGSPLRLHGVTRVADCRWPPGTLEVLDLANVDMATLPRAANTSRVPCPPTRSSPVPAAANLISSSPCITTRGTSP